MRKWEYWQAFDDINGQIWESFFGNFILLVYCKNGYISYYLLMLQWLAGTAIGSCFSYTHTSMAKYYVHCVITLACSHIIQYQQLVIKQEVSKLAMPIKKESWSVFNYLLNLLACSPVTIRLSLMLLLMLFSVPLPITEKSTILSKQDTCVYCCLSKLPTPFKRRYTSVPHPYRLCTAIPPPKYSA